MALQSQFRSYDAHHEARPAQGHPDVGAPGPDERAPAGRKGPAPVGTIVVKIGGSTLGSDDTSIEDVVQQQREDSRPVVVHGGGKLISEWMERQGIRPRFVRGLRVTDKATLEIVIGVLSGVINKAIVAEVNSRGGRAVGLSGVDGGLLKARIGEPELGFVGEITSVDVAPLRALMDSGYIPVIAPVAANVGDVSAGAVLNVNADTAAGEIAAAIGADSLVMLTDVAGVLDTSRRLLPRLTERQARSMVNSNVVAGGMVPKLEACITALGQVRSTHIVDGRKPHVLRELMAGGQIGTRVG